MDHALFMSSFHPFSNLAADLQGLLNRHWPFGNSLLQGFTWHQLQDQEMNVIGVLEAVNSCDVRVIQ